jgi:lauroyl/myristoyl acyltransferase
VPARFLRASRTVARSLYHRQEAHRLLPMALTRPIVRAQADRAWAQPQMRRRAELNMHFLLGRSERAAEAAALAPAYLFWSLLRAEYRWRPWLITRLPIQGLAYLTAARRHGRGVVLSTMHHGMRGGTTASFAHAGFRTHVVLAPELLHHPTPAQRQLVRIVERDSATFAAPGSYAHMTDLMRRGEVLSISSDLPGSCSTRILGRPVRTASGAARLALEMGSPIVPVTAHRAGWVQTLRVQEPIDPRDFTSITDVQQEIVRRHEPALLAWPEAVEQPLRRWTAAEPQDAAAFELSPAERLAFMP